MLNLKNEKGSITLFVLVSCMFFIASVTCVQIYMQSKKVAVDREYRQIKSNYEANTDNNSMNDAYNQLLQLKNLNIKLEKYNYNQENNQLLVEFSLQKNTTNVTNLNVKTIKYGWSISKPDDTVSDASDLTNIKWSYIERESANDKMIAINNDVSTPGDYYLIVVVDNNLFDLTVTV